jgi:hypothetical protein
MPVEFQPAYKKGTRNPNGTVADTYWQNHSDYKMKVKIDPKKKTLTGSAQIKYYNESPDSLRDIVIHTYPDYYKRGAVKAGFFGGTYDPKLESEGMVIDELIINGAKVDLKDEYNVWYSGTNYRIYFGKLAPRSSMDIQVKWHFTIPGKGFERSGAIDPTSMFIAYWYPEIAVYDDIKGWDDVLYDASAEFYHDNSNYDVEIEIPNNYLVWGCVAPSNPNEIYPDFILANLEKAKTSTTSIPIVTEANWKGLKTKSKIWKFNAKNFADFSFALSNHFIWDAGSHTDSYGSYFLNAVYDPKHPEFAAVLQTEQEAIKIFHNEFPKYEFPYHHFTIFNGLEGGGMEFPGMANDEEVSGKDWEEWTGEKKTDFEVQLGLSLHEMCHMYFPFIMGVNEKRYAWMDEGWASFSEYFIDGEPENNNYSQTYLGDQSTTPMMTPTYTQPQVSSVNSYSMGSFSYYSLYHLLGAEMFNKCLNAYMTRWNHKHPTPYDYFYTFNDVSGQDLNWFWKNWYFDWGYPDVGIQEFKNNTITFKNYGGKAMAFKIIVKYGDGTVTKDVVSPAVWKTSDTYTHIIESSTEITEIHLVCILGADANADNDSWFK